MHAALARAHCEKRRTYHVRTMYVPRTYAPTHPALCLGTSVPRQKMSRCVPIEGVSPELVHPTSFGGGVKPLVLGNLVQI